MSITPNDDGLLGPDALAWRVIAHPGSLVGGLRSLMIQSLHPLAMAGVAEHSDFRRRPLDRLKRTTYYVAATAYGDRATAMEAVRRVKRRHASVRGTDPVTGREYSADDPDTQVWVHITEWHSFLAAYRVFAGGLSPDDEDRYIREGTIIGSLLGTIMVANVWMRILPAQHQMLAATRAGRPADFTLGERAKQRSVHNSYMTFPLLFIMLSNHFPATYASPVNWLVLFLLFVAGASVRHAMIGRGSSSRWVLVPAALALAGAMFFSTPQGAAAPAPAAAADSVPPFHAVRAVIAERCQPCHSLYQSDRTLGPAPGGVAFDTPESIARLAERIRVRAVETKTMPLANKTGMTDEERALLARWISAGAPLR